MLTSIIAAIVTILSSLTAGGSVATVDDDHFANQTPYGDPAVAPVRVPPQGYELAFIETVGRHGARSLTSPDREQRALSVWSAAEQQDALTDLGRTFADDVAAFQAAEREIGYGNLSGVGAREWRGIGRRTAESYRTFLEQAAADGDAVVVRTSPIRRTVESADAMREGLEEAVPGLDVADYVTDAARLLIDDGASIAGDRAIETIRARPEVIAAAKHLLGRMYERAYVDALDDPVQAALDVYLLYCTAPGMADESDVTFRDYVPRSDAQVLEYAVDAGNFYAYGPGVAGEDSSYAATRPLLDDFFAELDARLAGGDTAAVFRLAHGETTMPFAALIDLPGSAEPAPADGVYTYGDNPWRGRRAGRLAGSIEWTAYRSRSGKALVTVRHNEQPVELAAACRPTVPYFYRVAELKRCLD